jgi:hypothetical protein
VVPLAQTFSLHSNPDSSLKIFLDVDGADVSGTSWNSSYGVLAGAHPAWDPAGNGPSFTDSELLAVQEVWAIVAEDYAPFGVDVTTQDPGQAGLVRSSTSDTAYGTRVLITPSTDAHSKICGSGCGGVAYLSVFNRVGSTLQPAWVFPQALGDDAKNVAEAASHEAGHNLGLSHDGSTTNTYYAGQGSWAPIMGVGYYKPVVQWSRGSYPGADNTAQDDLAVIASYLGRRTDEAPGPSGTPVPLPMGPGVITDASDVDTYLLGTCTGGSTVTVAPAAYAPNLDVQATLRDAAGTVVATSAPASGPGDGTTASGMGATLTVPVTATGWTVSVDGAGEGSWSSGGYDDYGSLGTYTVGAPGCGGDPVPGVPGAPQDLAAGSATLDSLTLTWTEPADLGDGPVTGYVVSRSGTTQTWTLGADARSHVFTGLSAGTSYQLSVRALNATGAGPGATVTASTTAPPAAVPGVPRYLTGAYIVADGEISTFWAEPTSSGSQPISGYAIYLDGVRLGQVGASSRGTTLTRPSGFAEGSYVVGVAAVNAVGESVRATTTVVVDLPAAPEAPTLVSVLPGNGTATVAWLVPSDNGSPLTEYAVLARSPGRTTRAVAAPATATGATVAGLDNGVTWTITVRATNLVGTSPESQGLAVVPVGTPTQTPGSTTTPSGPGTTTVAAPARMAAPKVKVKRRKAVVRWVPAVSTGTPVTAYLVDLSTGKDRSVAGSARKVALKLKPGKYRLRIAAVNANGQSPFSRWVRIRVR